MATIYHQKYYINLTTALRNYKETDENVSHDKVDQVVFVNAQVDQEPGEDSVDDQDSDDKEDKNDAGDDILRLAHVFQT